MIISASIVVDNRRLCGLESHIDVRSEIRRELSRELAQELASKSVMIETSRLRSHHFSTEFRASVCVVTPDEYEAFNAWKRSMKHGL